MIIYTNLYFQKTIVMIYLNCWNPQNIINTEGKRNMYKNYIFDLYGTLVDIHTDEKKITLWKNMAEFYAFYGANYTPTEMRKEYERLCREEEKKLALKHDYPEIKIEKVFKKLFLNKGIKTDTKTCIIAGQFFRVISTKYVKLYDETIELLKLLKQKGKKIYLLSNAQQIFTEYEIKALGIYDYFDGVLLSSDESCRKPSGEFFGCLFGRYDLKKEESVMIGNDWISDIEGANHFGIDAVYIHTDISPRDTIIENIHAKLIISDGDLGKIKKIIM